MMQKFKRAVSICSLVGLLSIPYNTKAQDATVITSEINYSRRIDIKVKPSYNITNGIKKSQLELMLGKKIKKNNYKLALYSDIKSDLEKSSWIGFRSEFDYKINNSHLGLQLRHFSGLNDNSNSHFYYITYIMQDLTKKLSIGICDYAKRNYKDKKGFSYLGPFISYSFTKNINGFFLYGKDKKEQLFYLKLNLDL